MKRIRSSTVSAIMVAFLVSMALAEFSASAQTDTAMAFHRTWERTDKPVADRVVSRTWMWGPDAASSQLQEQYAEAPGGTRTVIYSHKSRMEINHNPGVSPDSVWYVTNGLLVNEMVSGQMQVGDNTYVSREPARVNVAGDFDDPLGITYYLISLILDEPAQPEGTVITQVLQLSARSIIGVNDAMSTYGVTAARYVPETGHTVAGPFWEFMNSSGIVFENGQFVHAPLFLNPFYATGFPITEAYWSNVKVGGTYRWVLMQCFERRCLTYTPSNDPAWRVEAGNVGLHYHAWRYGDTGNQPPPPPATGEYQPWIYGLTKASVINYVTSVAAGRGETCEIENWGLQATYVECLGVLNGTPYVYEVLINSRPAENNVVQRIRVKVLNLGGGIQNTDAIAREVLGGVSRIPYTDSQPDRTYQIIVENIRGSGRFLAGSASFVINHPDMISDIAYERNLIIWATGLD